MMLIGLCGGIAAGKDTFYIRAQHLYGDRYSVERIGFADKVKESISELFGINSDFIETEKRNPNTNIILSSPILDHDGNTENGEIVFTFREFIQRYGTEAHRRVFGDMFWVEAALPLDYDHSGKLVFVTDVRFKTELARIVDLGGVNIHIENNNVATARESQHESENSLDMDLVTYSVDNRVRDDNFDSLDEQIVSILDNILELSTLGGLK